MTREIDRPSWANRIVAERTARNWSQSDLARALRLHAEEGTASTPGQQITGEDSLVRRIKAWEKGDNHPDRFYQELIARTFGTVTAAFFPDEARKASDLLVAPTGLDTLTIVNRLQRSDVDSATLEALRITVDSLCCEYPHMPSKDLLFEGRQWLRRIAEMLQTRSLTLHQHRESKVLAGWLALLVGCVEYDMGDRQAAEATRRAALSLAQEAENSEIAGWASEMRAWFALTAGDYRGVIAAARTGSELAPSHSVNVQLVAQEAKAWARIGDRRQVEVALDKGRRQLETMPYPENPAHHFVVDPAKFDFYAMDCYRLLRENELARTYAEEVIRTGTDFDGYEHSKMRNAEARITLGVVAAREGNLEEAVSFGHRSLNGDRQSVPSLLMVSRELGHALTERYDGHADVQNYLDRLRALRENP